MEESERMEREWIRERALTTQTKNVYKNISNSCITHASTCTESVHQQSSSNSSNSSDSTSRSNDRQIKYTESRSNQESERYERKKKQIQKVFQHTQRKSKIRTVYNLVLLKQVVCAEVISTNFKFIQIIPKKK